MKPDDLNELVTTPRADRRACHRVGEWARPLRIVVTMIRLIVLVVVVVGALGSGWSPARADTGFQPAARHRVGVDVGLGSAVGAAGLTYTLAPVPWLRLEVGGGVGISGTQLSAMPKLARGGQRDRFVAGAGMSWSRGRDAHGDKWNVPWGQRRRARIRAPFRQRGLDESGRWFDHAARPLPLRRFGAGRHGEARQPVPAIPRRRRLLVLSGAIVLK